MELKKCARCGCFYLSGNTVCNNCATKDEVEMFRLKNYMEENEITDLAVEKLAIDTEISAKNIYRYLGQEDFQQIITQAQNAITNG